MTCKWKTDPLGVQNLERLNTNLSKASAVPYTNKPIKYSNFCSHRHHKAGIGVQINDKVKKTPEKGIIFVWPQRRRFYYKKEMSALAWFIAQACYWLYLVNIFPSGSALLLPQPPWRYQPPVPKPENRDYIIEPDWDSHYT